MSCFFVYFSQETVPGFCIFKMAEDDELGLFLNIDKWLSPSKFSSFERYRKGEGLIEGLRISFDIAQKDVFLVAEEELQTNDVPRIAAFLEAFSARLKEQGRLLRCSIQNGRVLKLVAFSGVSMDVPFLLSEAVKSNNFEIVEVVTLLREKLRCHPRSFHGAFFEAARSGQDPAIFQLLSEVSNVTLLDSRERNVLHFLAKIGDEERSRALLEVFCQAQNERVPWLLGDRDARGKTPFDVALELGHAFFIEEIFDQVVSLVDRPFSRYLTGHLRLDGVKPPRIRRLFEDCVTADYSDEKNCLSRDVSNGDERFPIPAYNRTDQKDVALPRFEYITAVDGLPESTSYDLSLSCACPETCSLDCETCESQPVRERQSPGDYIFVSECNPACACSVDCERRESLAPLRCAFFRLELCFDKQKGWGVYYVDVGGEISEDTVIGEYVGVARRGAQCDNLYEFKTVTTENVEIAISAVEKGNFTRFINHSCNANLRTELHYRDCGDAAFPHVILVADRDISFGEELTLNYGKDYWQALKGAQSCLCGSEECQFPG